AAPASESSVIRELRERNRQLTDQIREISKSQGAPKKIEVGKKPEMDDPEIDFDQDKYEAAYDAWHQRKAKAAEQESQEQQRAEKEREVWQQRAKAYEANKTALNVSDYEDAESE